MITRNFRRMVEMVIKTRPEGTVPVGTVIMYPQAPPNPVGWLSCEGQAVSRTIYKDLFTVIGTIYGTGDGSTTFNVPNIKGRVVVGGDATQTEFDALGETGGAKTHQLTVTEMPAHNHNANATVFGTTGAGAYALTGSTPVDVGIQNAGGGQPHNNLQPYIVMNYLIKY